jgi:cobalt/nickel transport system ATP-binding protein
MVAPLLELRDLSFGYTHGHWALRDISLAVKAGERVVLMGGNGAGKSSLLLMLEGTEQPCAGSVLLDGEVLSGAKEQAALLRRSVGVLLQDPDDQLIAPTVEQDVAIAPLLLGATPPEARRVVREVLTQLEIDHLAARPVHELSLGEKKRVALAGVVALRPRALLLDEPTAGLDPSGVKALARILNTLQQEGTAIVQATHDVNFAWDWADSAYLLHRGRLLGGGDAAVVLADEDLLQQAGLELPLRLQATLSTRSSLR